MGAGARAHEAGIFPLPQLPNSPLTASCSSPEPVLWEFRPSRTRKAALSLTNGGAPRGGGQNRKAPEQSQAQKENPKLAAVRVGRQPPHSSEEEAEEVPESPHLEGT